MFTPRKFQIDPETPLLYHFASRCVRHSFLSGLDPDTGEDLGHRQQWFIERLNFLAPHFAVDLYGFRIMHNHFHLALFHDPKTHLRWTDDEVADRWLAVSPPRTCGRKQLTPVFLAEHRKALLTEQERLAHVRRELGSVSTFMKFLKQGIARRANHEQGTIGHFFEQRVWASAVLTDRAVASTMQYIDLNPVRAILARRLEEIRAAGIADRLAHLEADPRSLELYLKSAPSELGSAWAVVPISLRSYIEQMEVISNTQYPEGQP